MVSSVAGKKYLTENAKYAVEIAIVHWLFRPFTMTFMQGFYGTCFSFLMFTVSYEEKFIKQSIQHIFSSPEIMFWVVLSSVLQFIGTLTTNISTTISSNSFVNTIKVASSFRSSFLILFIRSSLRRQTHFSPAYYRKLFWKNHLTIQLSFLFSLSSLVLLWLVGLNSIFSMFFFMLIHITDIIDSQDSFSRSLASFVSHYVLLEQKR
jgi:hypothetical protein